ncbi:putative MFS transporter [Aspergillus clavatus NRRL 1]|uniref:MFS transporter, putative n=1 Tax=Aspergillus clavatus (strain ATCC 1007 / CBS 513.65 / DSM 816 / NCTC 3887 / NRRL 1 / QM 1276 / 107) TaxID=344612 RepID=A1CUT2_ASPCL|nr:MFS transporter, putative [Aspergillus clavatus NRRL 1]EAW07069.1 MFS transporter, putative [Aspergillus clavatus NRRL 1]
MSTTTTATIKPANSLVLEVSNLEPPGNGQSASRESQLQKIVGLSQLGAVTLTASVINGLVIVSLPTITKDIHLPSSLSFWPSSVSSLATASTLLLAGSLADTVGPRWVELVGSFASGALMIGQGVARTGQELVVLRALQGVGLAMHLASSISIVTQLLPPGRSRNVAFSCLGLSQPLGFSLGLVFGGILVDTIGWRSGWFISGGITVFFAFVGLWALPRSKSTPNSDRLRNIKNKIDWVGAGLASTFMALLCYLLAANPSRIKAADSIIVLCLAALALPSFVGWVHYQSQRNRPALIPNSLWKNTAFSSICAILAISTAVVNSMELFASLFFQEVQGLSALNASVRILPSLIVGVLLNLVIGVFVHKVPAFWIASVTSLLCAGSPLLMAVIQPAWPYWANAFIAQLLQPVSFNALYTVGLIIITNSFLDDTQALAGAVFNTAAQFGSALGLAILQVISTLVTEETGGDRTAALMAGYRASFWTMFGFMILCTVMGYFGLRKAGKVGLKRD